MRKTHFTASIIALALAGTLSGCGAKADPNKREPGKWKTEMKLEGFELTGVPAGMEAQMAAMKPQIEAAMAEKMKSAGLGEQCYSAEQSSQEDISKGLTKGFAQTGSCKETKNSVTGGKIDFAATCDLAGQSVNIAMNGTMEPKKIDAVMNFNALPESGKPGMDMKIRVLATHMGKCTA